MRPRTTMRILAGLLLFSCAAAAQLAVRGDVVHTMAGGAIEDGVVLVRDGKIAEVGPASRVDVPDGWRVLRAKVVTPGLIDAHSVVGLAGHLNSKGDQEQLDRSSAVQPELRALDAYNPRENLVTWLREHGVTTIHTGHAPGAVIPGQGLIVKTRQAPVEEVALRKTASILAVLGDAAKASGGKSPGTRSKTVAMLRAELVKAKEYARKRAAAADDKKPSRDLGLEALSEVLAGRLPLVVTANRDRDIVTALRLAEEFGFKLVLDGAAEVMEVVDQVKAAGVPVILHPTMVRSRGDRENVSFETAARLKKAGVRFALQSGYESYVPKTRVVLFEAAIAAANGLGFEGALASITIDAARILGLDERIGSIAAGKDADLALFDGDPFEYTTHCVGTVIEGEIVSRGER